MDPQLLYSLKNWQAQRRRLPWEADFPLCLAPMVGLSHGPLKKVLRRYLPEGARTPWPTEMLNSRRLPSEKWENHLETESLLYEQDLVPQLLANEQDPIQASISRLSSQCPGIVGIDINMGCPVRKALKHNYGVALMGDPDYAAQVVSWTAQSSSLPVGVKLRSVSEKGNLLEFAGALVKAGARWLTLHPRVAQQQRRGQALVGEIRMLREGLASEETAIIGNANIQCVEDVYDLINETQADLVMSGRALAAKPWILWQIGEDLKWGERLVGERPWAPPEAAHWKVAAGRARHVAPGDEAGVVDGRRAGGPRAAPRTPEEEGAEYGRVIDLLIGEFLKLPQQDLNLRKFLFWLRMTTGWLEFGQCLLGTLGNSRSLEEAREKAKTFFQGEHRVFKRTTNLN